MQLIDSSGAPLLQPGERLEAIPLLRNLGDVASVELVWESDKPSAKITVGPESFHLFRLIQ